MNQSLLLDIPEYGSNPCFHCGLPVPPGGCFSTTDNSYVREFCCAGCMAITDFIEEGGLSRYYDLRDTVGNRPGEQETEEFGVYDNEILQRGWIQKTEYRHRGEFLIEGMSCSACIWLIESWLSRLTGVETINLNYSTQRLSLEWDPGKIKVSDILQQIQRIGYKAHPYSRDARFMILEKQKSALLKKLGVAAALGMQIMVISVALYGGNWFGIEPEFEQFLQKINLLLVLPLLGYSAKPFFTGAWRSIRTRTPNMDLSVSLGIGLAFVGSFWATMTKQGDVYYDSIAMFVFFLLGARFLETNSRLKGSQLMEPLASVVPATATRVITNGGQPEFQVVAVAELKVNDHLIIKPGEVVPVDGEILKGQSGFDESMLTGEPRPLIKNKGNKVFAGAINIDQVVTIKTTTEQGQTMLSSILELADQANFTKPQVTQYVEKFSGWFVLGVIMLASVVAGFGLWQGDENWLPVTIAVLVVTCPCALSLATPLALVAGANNLMRHGVYIVGSHAIETLNRINHFVFDKTGTLTRGIPELVLINTYGNQDRDQCLRIAAALEYGSSHPLGKAIVKSASHLDVLWVDNEKNVPGCGIEGFLNNCNYCLGSLEFVNRWIVSMTGVEINNEILRTLANEENQTVILGSEDGLIASFTFSDGIREGAVALIRELQLNHVETSLVSGDRKLPVAKVADQLGIKSFYGDCKPEDKLEIMTRFIGNRDTVAMVGDGINDTPAMNIAHLSIALARNINLTAANADIIVTNSSLAALVNARSTAKKTFSIIRQNIAWAILYNVCAIPAALAGWVPPWLAGIGMSLSSVLVVLNASRISAGSASHKK